MKMQPPTPPVPKKRGVIILLNGVSSAGKTSLSRKIQELAAEPVFHLSIDVFEYMVSKKHLEADFWLHLNQAASAMHHTIALFSDMGLNVVVDTVLIDIPEAANWLHECVATFDGYPTLFVGVHCTPDELDRREKARTDRKPGQARWQLDKVHRHGLYDVEVDTHRLSLEESAKKVFAALKKLNPGHMAMDTLRKRFKAEPK